MPKKYDADWLAGRYETIAVAVKESIEERLAGRPAEIERGYVNSLLQLFETAQTAFDEMPRPVNAISPRHAQKLIVESYARATNTTLPDDISAYKALLEDLTSLVRGLEDPKTTLNSKDSKKYKDLAKMMGVISQRANSYRHRAFMDEHTSGHLRII